MNKNCNYTELDDFDKKNLLTLISRQNLKELRRLPLCNYNLNFLIEDFDIQFDNKISPLLSACYIGKIEIVMILLENEGLDVDQESYPENYTPLMVACFKGFYEIVKLLLERNANVNKINRHNQQPILFCFSRLEETFYRYENKKICMMLLDLLLSKGADINIRIDQKLGYTILMKLVSTEFQNREKLNNTIEIIKFLIERGADASILGYNNKSVYDVINSNTEKSLREELFNVLENTKQTICYDIEDITLSIKKNLSSSEKTTKNTYNSEYLILDQTGVRTNCCAICKFFI